MYNRLSHSILNLMLAAMLLFPVTVAAQDLRARLAEETPTTEDRPVDSDSFRFVSGPGRGSGPHIAILEELVRAPFLLQFSYADVIGLDEGGFGIFFGKPARSLEVNSPSERGNRFGIPAGRQGSALFFVLGDEQRVILADGANRALNEAPVREAATGAGPADWKEAELLVLPDRVTLMVDGEVLIDSFGPYFSPNQTLAFASGGAEGGARIRDIVLSVPGSGAGSRVASPESATAEAIPMPVDSGWTMDEYEGHDWRSFRQRADVASEIGIEPDLALLNAAIFYETNRVRERHGLPSYSHHPGAEEAATGHSRAMAEEGFFSHISPVPGMRTPKDRLEAVPVSFSMAGENILGAAENGSSGRHLERSYLDYAEGAVGAWLGSPGHRANILHRDFTHLGVGVAVKRDANSSSLYFYRTQSFLVPR